MTGSTPPTIPTIALKKNTQPALKANAKNSFWPIFPTSIESSVTPAAIAGVSWIVFLRLFAKTKTAYGGQLATFVRHYSAYFSGFILHSSGSVLIFPYAILAADNKLSSTAKLLH